jgi:acetyltransferase-like isoleucine patch superfamily enzyme
MVLSEAFRFLFHRYQVICSKLRVAKINMLYTGANIDFKTTIDRNCTIVCVKGGTLTISNCSIKAGTHIFADTESTVTINDSFIGRNCVIVAKKMITIKLGCQVAEMVVIRDHDHFINGKERQSQQNQFITDSICIEENVWLASKATILKGVSVGSSAIVAASAVVNISVPSQELWGGIPAKFIKKLV